jgi:hypothetical protein
MKRQALIGLMGWLALLALYGATRWAREHLDLPVFFRDHFTDLLFIPVQLIAALWITRIVRRDMELRISAIWVVLQVVLVSVLFEWYMPTYGAQRTHFTADLKDVAMYVLGGAWFMWFQYWERDGFWGAGSNKN